MSADSLVIFTWVGWGRVRFRVSGALGSRVYGTITAGIGGGKDSKGYSYGAQGRQLISKELSRRRLNHRKLHHRSTHGSVMQRKQVWMSEHRRNGL